MLEISKSGLLNIWQHIITIRAPVGANKYNTSVRTEDATSD